jgi:hypothetical protein
MLEFIIFYVNDKPEMLRKKSCVEKAYFEEMVHIFFGCTFFVVCKD